MAAKSQTRTRSAIASPAKPLGARRPTKSGYINARIEPGLKKKAEAVLGKIGLSTTDAVTIFFKQVVAQKGLPFSVNIPNRETIRAMRELENGGGTRHEGDVASLFASILQPRARKS